MGFAIFETERMNDGRSMRCSTRIVARHIRRLRWQASVRWNPSRHDARCCIDTDLLTEQIRRLPFDGATQLTAAAATPLFGRKRGLTLVCERVK